VVTSDYPVFSPRKIDNATLRLLLAIARIADDAEQLAAFGAINTAFNGGTCPSSEFLGQGAA
jgi:hypothetical protein